MKDAPKDLNRIPKEQLTAYERWELPLLDASGNEVAREEERDVKPLTAGDLSEIRKAAREDGYREGRDEGYQAGLEEGRAQGREEGLQAGLAEGREQGQQQGHEETRQDMDAKLERLEQLMGALVQPIRRHEDEVESALLNLTTALARAVLYRELTIDSSQIQRVVRAALAALPSTADNLRIHVHPNDCDSVREVAARLEAQASVIEDDKVLPGGCKIESRHSLVDFTVEKRFQRTVQNMLEQQAGEVDANEADELDAVMGDLTDFQRDVLDTPEPGDEKGEEKGKEDGENDDRAPG